MRTVQEYRCLLISPTDVLHERNYIADTISKWNAYIGARLGVRIELVRWETHMTPALGGHPQDLLNQQLVDSCDFGVALFGNKLGTPTKNHPSGSVEEISRLSANRKPVMVYFKEDSTQSRSEEVASYQSKLMQEAFVDKFSTTENLAQKVTLHLSDVVLQLMKTEGSAVAPELIESDTRKTVFTKNDTVVGNTPIFESEMWPEEGIPCFEAINTELILRVRPGAGSPEECRLHVKRGDKVLFSGFRYRTITPGTVLCTQAAVLHGRDLGPISYLSRESHRARAPEVRIDCSAGEQIAYLQYTAEGGGLIRHYDGHVIELGHCPWFHDEEFKLITQPVTESWLQVVGRDNKPLGWLAVDGAAEEVGRDLW